MISHFVYKALSSSINHQQVNWSNQRPSHLLFSNSLLGGCTRPVARGVQARWCNSPPPQKKKKLIIYKKVHILWYMQTANTLPNHRITVDHLFLWLLYYASTALLQTFALPRCEKGPFFHDSHLPQKNPSYRPEL